MTKQHHLRKLLVRRARHSAAWTNCDVSLPTTDNTLTPVVAEDAAPDHGTHKVQVSEVPSMAMATHQLEDYAQLESQNLRPVALALSLASALRETCRNPILSRMNG